jgi:4-diphosphocytidyl-2-C-methyl-D-erythritol kinase
MILFSPAKINIGLQILQQRKDGFHDLQSVMAPVGLCDILEINTLPAKYNTPAFKQSGIRFESDQENNLCIKALDLMAEETTIPPVQIYLHKQIPVGAGLGGGSSNASTVLMGLNTLASEPLPAERLAQLAAILGSDCPFFLHHEPMLMEGRGEILSPISLDLQQLHLVLIFPEIHVTTAEAYAGVTPAIPKRFLSELLQEPILQWRDLIVNDFEKSVFLRYPELSTLKEELYKTGAVYASLSGSGSSLYGLFRSPPDLPGVIRNHVVWEGAMRTQPAGGL